MALRGRPHRVESEARRREFVRLVVAGEPLPVAAEKARVKPERALALVDTPEIIQILAQRPALRLVA